MSIFGGDFFVDVIDAEVWTDLANGYVAADGDDAVRVPNGLMYAFVSARLWTLLWFKSIAFAKSRYVRKIFALSLKRSVCFKDKRKRQCCRSKAHKLHHNFLELPFS